MKISLVTFGCRLNHAEALDIEASLSAIGHEIIPLPQAGSDPTTPQGSDPTTPITPQGSDPNPPTGSGPITPQGSGPITEKQHFIIKTNNFPQVIIVRCCSVTAKAEHDCNKEISRLKLRFPNTDIIITGCHPQARTLPSSLYHPPTGSGPNCATGSGPNCATGSGPNCATSPVPTATSRAYLKIQDGCNGKCSYCIVPHFRGQPVSIPLPDILSRATAFLEAGFHEIVVTGCNLSLYRFNGEKLPSVLNTLANLSVEGLTPKALMPPKTLQWGLTPINQWGLAPEAQGHAHRIRLGSVEPGLIGTELLDVFEKNNNICRFIHLSLQSGSDNILKAMNRPYRISAVAEFIQEAYRRLGRFLTIGADIITGFPGETNADFESTRSILAEHRITNLHVFPYSERPGTPAAVMAGSIPSETRRLRAKILSDEARERKKRFTESFAGRTVEVCVEKGGEHGWTGEYLPVKLTPPRPRRSLVRINVSSVDQGVLFERQV